MNIARFNPQSLSDTQIRLLSTGRDRLVGAVAASLLDGSGVRQHVLISGPRGFGKSFLLRAVKLEIAEREESVKVIILPEEQLNITTPSGFLREITRNLAQRPPSALTGQFLDDKDGDWDSALEEIDAELAKLNKNQLVIIGIENFDELIESVFDDPPDQSKLRIFLSDSKKLGIVATSLSADVDQDYDQRLFNAFAKHQLKPWSNEDHFLYFERRAILEGKDPSFLDHGRIRALAKFTGGAPRMAVILGDLLLEGDPLSAAGVLDKMVDELTPYYQNILDRMPARTRTLFDALIRQSEPCSQSDLAARVGTSQNRIAQHFAWLRERHLVVGKRRQGGRDYLYQVSDRLFVQYYRKRYLFEDNYTPLAGMAELLDGFFSVAENNEQAMSLFENGKTDEACEFIRASMRSIKGELGTWSQRSKNVAALQAFGESEEGNFEEAIHYFQKAIVITEREDDPIGTAVLLGQQGLCYAKTKKITKAIEAHLQALEIWDLMERDDGRAWILGQLAQSFRNARQYDDALHYARLALEIWESQGTQDRMASTLGEIGENLRRMGRANEAIKAYSQAADLWGSVGDNAAVGWIHGGIGLAKRQAGDYQGSVSYHKQAIKLLKRFKKKEPNVAYNLNWAAVSYRHIGEFDAALECDRKALDLWTDIDSLRNLTMTLSSITQNFLGLEDFGRALITAVNALKAARKGSFQNQIIWTAGQISYLHLKSGNAQQIWQYLDEGNVHNRKMLYEMVLSKAASGLVKFRQETGRSAAFRQGIEIIDGLMNRANHYPATQSVMFFMTGLLASERSYALVLDLVSEVEARDLGLMPQQTLAISHAARLLEEGADDRVIERLDPDVSSAVRAILASVATQKKNGTAEVEVS